MIGWPGELIMLINNAFDVVLVVAVNIIPWLISANWIYFFKGHDADLINTGISSNGKFIMTCSKDTTIKLWDLKGNVSGRFNSLVWACNLDSEFIFTSQNMDVCYTDILFNLFAFCYWKSLYGFVSFVK